MRPSAFVRFLLALGALAAGTGCVGWADAGGDLDAGGSQDAGDELDAGGDLDAGGSQDAGGDVDAGATGLDAGSSFDAGGTAVGPGERPFDPDHPVYHPIPSSCPLDPQSSVIVASVAANHATLAFDTHADSPAVYLGASSDPTYALSIAGTTFQVHVPNNAQPGSGVDGPLVVVDLSSAAYGGLPVEYRMWQASVDHAQHKVSCSWGGVGVIANDGQPHYQGRRATGHAEIWGTNTGSGESYTVGMIRPVDVRRGRIDHAIRVAIGYPHGAKWVWPATRTEPNQPYSGVGDERAPMGARIFLDPSVDATAVGDAAAARLADPRAKAFVRMFVRALQEYGMVALDGTGSGHNVYFEGEGSADWETLLGPKNAYGSYNDLARAVAAELPWSKLRVADGSVFDAFAR